MKKLASWDTVDFSSSSDNEITQTLKSLNIPLSVDEAKKIQFSFLKRAATLTELVLFSIQGSEHSSYKSSKNHISKNENHINNIKNYMKNNKTL